MHNNRVSICLFIYKYNLPSWREITSHGQPLKICTLKHKDTVLGDGKGEWIWNVIKIVRMWYTSSILCPLKWNVFSC